MCVDRVVDGAGRVGAGDKVGGPPEPLDVSTLLLGSPCS